MPADQNANPFSYIRNEGCKDDYRIRLIAIVAESHRKRTYGCRGVTENIAIHDLQDNIVDVDLPEVALGSESELRYQAVFTDVQQTAEERSAYIQRSGKGCL